MSNLMHVRTYKGACMGDLDIGGRMMLKWILNKKDW